MGGLILGGLHSSSGKTAVTCMLLAALSKRGRRVQPFKVGPDFIDAAYHHLYCGLPSRTLDFWLMGGEDAVRAEALRATADCPGIAEGVMGLFDGWTPASDSESTMHLSRLLEWPVVLVVPCRKMGRSLAVALRGFIEEAGEGRIAGVILNQVSGASHSEYMKEAIRPLGLQVLGALPESELLVWPERHLGLQAAQEGNLPSVDDLAEFAEAHLDVDALLRVAEGSSRSPIAEDVGIENRKRYRIAVARDEVFHFYYPNCLDQCDVVPFSPLHDRGIPEADAVVFGGGFPEIYAERLSANRTMMTEIRSAIEDGKPVLAECGGLMYLADSLKVGTETFPMAGVVPGTVEMGGRLQHFGYCSAGANVRGHEFHHSRWREEPDSANLWQVAKRRSRQSRMEGFQIRNLQATYVHSMWSPERILFQNL